MRICRCEAYFRGVICRLVKLGTLGPLSNVVDVVYGAWSWLVQHVFFGRFGRRRTIYDTSDIESWIRFVVMLSERCDIAWIAFESFSRHVVVNILKIFFTPHPRFVERM